MRRDTGWRAVVNLSSERTLSGSDEGFQACSPLTLVEFRLCCQDNSLHERKKKKKRFYKWNDPTDPHTGTPPTHTWAHLVCQRFSFSHLVDILLWVEVIPFVQAPAELMEDTRVGGQSGSAPPHVVIEVVKLVPFLTGVRPKSSCIRRGDNYNLYTRLQMRFVTSAFKVLNYGSCSGAIWEFIGDALHFKAMAHL